MTNDKVEATFYEGADAVQAPTHDIQPTGEIGPDLLPVEACTRCGLRTDQINQTTPCVPMEE